MTDRGLAENGGLSAGRTGPFFTTLRGLAVHGQNFARYLKRWVAHGYAEVVEVPGDQMPALRRAVRAVIKQRLGYKTETFVRGGRLFVSSAEAYAPHAQRHMAEAAAAMNTIFGDEDVAPIDDSGWRLRWTTWSVS